MNVSVMIILVLVPMIIAGRARARICKDSVSCAAYYQHNKPFSAALKARCAFSASPNATLYFSHVPHAGGSSVVRALSKLAPGRFRPPAHVGETFMDLSARIRAANERVSPILATLIRRPGDRAAGLFRDLRARSSFIGLAAEDRILWERARAMNASQWITNDDVRMTLSKTFARMFARDNSMLMAGAGAAGGTRGLPRDWVASLRIDILPADYRCRDDMNALKTLMEQYAAVGATGSTRGPFWEVLWKRAGLPADKLDEAKRQNDEDMGANRRDKTVKAEMDVIKRTVGSDWRFFCQRLVVEMVDMIAAKDHECIKEAGKKKKKSAAKSVPKPIEKPIAKLKPKNKPKKKTM